MTLAERCRFCNMPIQGETCEFAVYKKTVKGKDYYFCCERCAAEFEESQKSSANP